MKIKRMVKRLFAVGTGVAMLGATAMGAMAADLKDYPTQFATDGTFNGYFVVGEKASSTDNLAMTDIAASMKVVKTAATTAVTTVEGDAWKVATASQQFELANNNASDSSIAGERIAAITTSISKSDLAALADGTFATNAQTYPYKQYLYFDNPTTSSQIVKYTKNTDAEPEVTDAHFYQASSTNIARYRLEFTSTAQSKLYDTSDVEVSTGVKLRDFEGKVIKMLGKEYTIVQARRDSGDYDSVSLTLMSGTTGDTLLEGETKTYTVAGKEYEISANYVDTTNAKFTINGEQTSKLQQGDTYVLKDKTEIGVSEVLYQGYAGGVHSASFYIGATKMVLKDTTITDTVNSDDLKVGSETQDGAEVVIQGTNTTSTFSIRTIDVNVTSPDNLWVGKNDKLSASLARAGEKAGILMGGAFDIEYKGLTEEETHEIGLRTSSSRKYVLKLYDADNKQVDIPVAYEEQQYNLTQGVESYTSADGSRKALVLIEKPIYRNDYFVLSQGTPSSGSAKSYLLQYRGADNTGKSNPKIKFKNEGSGEILEYSVSTTMPLATIQLGGYSFQVVNHTTMGADDFQVNISLNGDGDYSDSPRVNFVDYYGSQWAIANTTTNGSVVIGNSTEQAYIAITVTTPNANDYDNQYPSDMMFNISAGANNVLSATMATATGMTLLTPDGVTDKSYGYTAMGTFVTWNNPSNDADEFILKYPKKQILPLMYVTTGATTTTTTSAADMVAVTIVDATKLDSEVADVKAQNLVVVGGPCVNSVAAELMGNPTDCTEGFAPGKARVKLFENGDKVAMLVAGYSGADTRLAGKVVAHRSKEMSGKEVEIEGTTYSDATIAAPTTKTVVATTETTTQ